MSDVASLRALSPTSTLESEEKMDEDNATREAESISTDSTQTELYPDIIEDCSGESGGVQRLRLVGYIRIMSSESQPSATLDGSESDSVLADPILAPSDELEEDAAKLAIVVPTDDVSKSDSFLVVHGEPVSAATNSSQTTGQAKRDTSFVDSNEFSAVDDVATGDEATTDSLLAEPETPNITTESPSKLIVSPENVDLSETWMDLWSDCNLCMNSSHYSSKPLL